MKLTYAIWNTLAGGTDAGSDARLRRQMALLASFSPTVVGLQECKYWDRDYFRTFHLAEELLGMRGFLAPSAHHGCHLAIFIRENADLRVTEQRHEHGHPYWHGAARVVAQADGHPDPLQLASIHLAPSSPVTAQEPLATGLPEAITAARTQAGSLLAGLRHQAGLSQVQLAWRIGYSPTAVAHAELARRPVSAEFWEVAATAGLPHPVPEVADSPVTSEPARVLAVDYGGHPAAFPLLRWCPKERQMTGKVFKTASGRHSLLTRGQGHDDG